MTKRRTKVCSVYLPITSSSCLQLSSTLQHNTFKVINISILDNVITYNLPKNVLPTFTEVLSSDEDDLDEMNNEYLENLARMALKTSERQGVTMTANVEEYEESDDVSPLVSMICFLRTKC